MSPLVLLLLYEPISGTRTPTLLSPSRSYYIRISAPRHIVFPVLFSTSHASFNNDDVCFRRPRQTHGVHLSLLPTHSSLRVALQSHRLDHNG